MIQETTPTLRPEDPAAPAGEGEEAAAGAAGAAALDRQRGLHGPPTNLSFLLPRMRPPLPARRRLPHRVPRCHFSRGRSRSAKRPGPAAFPCGSTRRALCDGRETVHARRSRNRCKGESGDIFPTAGADPRDFEGPYGEGFRRGRSLRARAPREFKPKGPNRRCEPSGLTLSAACSRSERRGRKPVTAMARFSLLAAGPERADEGGGPTPGRLRWGTTC
jgi:hypothetical protein